VLCEASGGFIYAGIGVNCSQKTFPAGFRTEPTSIYMETGIHPEPENLLKHLAAAFFALRGGATAWKDDYEALLAWRGQWVCFSPGIDREPVEGILRGIDATGAVLIDRDGEGDVTAWPSGELTARY